MIADVTMRRLWYNHPFASEEEVDAFAKDALDARKFRLVREIHCYDKDWQEAPCRHWFLRSGLVSLCTSLQHFDISIPNIEGVRLLSAASWPSLLNLSIRFDYQFEDSPEIKGLEFHFPSLERLKVERYPPGAIATLIDGAPKLEHLHWDCTSESLDPAQITGLPGVFVSKVTEMTVTCNSDLRGLVVGRQDFRPAIVNGSDLTLEYGPDVSMAETVGLWKALVEMACLNDVDISWLSSEALLHGFPRDACVVLYHLQLSGLSPDQLTQLERTLSTHASRSLEIDVFVDWATGDTKARRRAYANEMLFWTRLDIPGVDIGFYDRGSLELDKHQLEGQAFGVLTTPVD